MPTFPVARATRSRCGTTFRAWQRFAIQPRVLVGATGPDLAVTVLGRSRPHPLIIAPMAAHRLADPDGEAATARAAAAAGTVICLSTFADVGLTELARAVPGSTRWFQLYVFRDRGLSDELIAQVVMPSATTSTSSWTEGSVAAPTC